MLFTSPVSSFSIMANSLCVCVCLRCLRVWRKTWEVGSGSAFIHTALFSALWKTQQKKSTALATVHLSSSSCSAACVCVCVLHTPPARSLTLSLWLQPSIKAQRNKAQLRIITRYLPIQPNSSLSDAWQHSHCHVPPQHDSGWLHPACS